MIVFVIGWCMCGVILCCCRILGRVLMLLNLLMVKIVMGMKCDLRLVNLWMIFGLKLFIWCMSSLLWWV